MIWRAWCFVAGLAPGALAGIALAPGPADPSPLWPQLGALCGGLLLLLLAHLLNRRPQDEPDRGARFARAASVGLLALPALALTLLQLAPGPRVLFAIVAACLGFAFIRAVRRRAPAGGIAGQATSVFGVLVLGSAALLLLSGLIASLRAEPPVRTEGNRNAVLDHDATIETIALPVCEPRAARVDVVHGAGANPKLDGSGETLWFDAEGPDGRRQVHRMRLATGEVTCLTCDEPGNNRRPAPNREGSVVLFDSDRYATWRHPGNTELQLLNTTAAARGVPSRRITYSPGPDERPLFAPAANTLAWSRGEGGRYRVVSGGLVSGHGSLQVGGTGTLGDGGSEWLAPLAWSPDARTLAFSRGNPLGPAAIAAIDPATEREVPLGDSVAVPGSLSFNADGGWYALASARRAEPAGLLPGALGFALASTAPFRGPATYRGTRVVVGPVDGEALEVDLGETADWGWPTGLSLHPDGTRFVLGQRREAAASEADGSGGTERIVAVALDCPE